MGEGFITRRGGVTSEETAAPTITIVSEDPTGVTFTLTNNDDNTALITHEVDDNIGGVELAAAATSSNITVALAVGTYTLTAFATVVGEVATQSTAAVEIVVIPEYEELFSQDVTTAATQIDITGLNIGKDDTVRLVYTFVGDTTLTANYELRVNDISSNYTNQQLNGDGTLFEAVRSNSNSLAFARSDRKVAGFADIKVSENSRFVVQSQFLFRFAANAASMRQQNHNMINTGTVTSITKLSIVSSRTNGIAVGSKIALYKVTEAA